MNKKKVAIVSLLLAVGIATVFVAFLPKFRSICNKNYINKYKEIFKGLTPQSEDDSLNNIYTARYELTLNEWQMVQGNLDEFEIISNNGDYYRCVRMFAESHFSEIEIKDMTDVYYLGKFVRFPLKKQWFEVLVSVYPNTNGVSIFFSVNMNEPNVN